jgi:hypothetical protein
MSIVTRSRSEHLLEVGTRGDCLAIPARLVEDHKADLIKSSTTERS